MPPPKQNPTTPIFWPGARRCSSPTAAFMSAMNRSSGAAFSAAVAAAESVKLSVPPSAESRSMASAEKPLAASRPATERMWSVSPRFS